MLDSLIEKSSVSMKNVQSRQASDLPEENFVSKNNFNWTS